MAMTPVPQVDPALAAQYKAAANAFTAKNWQNGVASPVAAQVPMPSNPTQYAAAANAFTAKNWTNGTANGLTDSQNLANVVNQPGNTVAQNPTPYIQKVLGQAASDTAAQVPKPQGTFNTLGSAGDGNSAPMGAVPPPSAPTPPKFDAAGIAASRVAAQRAALAGSVAAYDASRKQGFDYATKNMQDQRVLDAAMFHEQNNPFSGKYQYDKTNILRNNGIQDTQNQMQYNNDIAASDAKLAAFDAGAPGMQQDIQQQLEHQNLQDNIAQAPYTGMLNGQQTQQAQAQGFNQNLQQNQNNFNQNLQTNQFNQQAQNQQFNQGMQTQQFAYQQARDSIKDQQYQQTFDNNVKQQGLDFALKQATLANQITNDQAQRAIGYMNANISQQNANTSAANSANSNSNMQQDNLMNIWKATGKAPAGITGVAEGTPIAQASSSGQNVKSLDSTYVSNLSAMSPDKRDAFFKNEKANIIKDLGISGYNQLYNMYYDQNGAPKQ